jgi:cellulose synthase (UDP-forming)
MKYKLIIVLLVGIFVLRSAEAGVATGIYDPFKKMEKVKFTYEHLWYYWQKPNPPEGNIYFQLKTVIKKGRTPIVTVEPWDIPAIGTRVGLLPDIAAGKYDPIVTDLATQIGLLGYPVVIRWGHECECIPDYPWSGRPPGEYIAAYRHVAWIFKKYAPTSLMFWSPVGNKGVEVYYPGTDVVDYIGFTVLEYPQVSVGWFGHPQSFEGWVREKYDRISQFNKPVIIPECGVYDTPANQKKWMQEAFASVDKFPLLQVVVYFNVKDHVTWKQADGKIKIPDWRISPSVFSTL